MLNTEINANPEHIQKRYCNYMHVYSSAHLNCIYYEPSTHTINTYSTHYTLSTLMGLWSQIYALVVTLWCDDNRKHVPSRYVCPGRTRPSSC